MRNYKNIPIPITKEPYVNTCLYHAGYEKETGLERFWVTSWNSNVGSTGILVNENGEEKTFRFRKDGSSPLAKCGFYSACYVGNDIMWLAGDLAQLFRLDFSTGEITGFKTGAPSGLVFTGMVYDEPTGKLFFSAYVPPREVSVSFDTKKLETVKIYDGVIPGTWAGCSIPNPDGTYTVPYEDQNDKIWHYNVWDPKAETFTDVITTHYTMPNKTLMKDGKAYLCHGNDRCWYDPSDNSFTKGTVCDVPAFFFASKDNVAYGAVSYGETTNIVSWDMRATEHKVLCKVQNSGGNLMRLTGDDHIVGVTVYGDFFKCDLSGNIVMEKELDSRSIGSLDCLLITDDNILVGTPFITQRFWVHDLKTGIGYDAGKAANGGGEVLRIAEINGKVYMASYTQGKLTEYDPKKPGQFPENPRIVAAPKHSLRPKCHAVDGESFYYISNHPYGTAGAEAVKYNTVTGEMISCDSPVDGLSFTSLFWNKKHNVLVAGSTVATDCGIARETADICCAAVLSTDTMEPICTFNAEKGVRSIEAKGEINDDEYLFFINGSASKPCILNISNAVERKTLEMRPINIQFECRWYIYADKQGFFIGADGKGISLYFCDGKSVSKVKNIVEVNRYLRAFVSNGCLLVADNEKIDIFEIFE